MSDTNNQQNKDQTLGNDEVSKNHNEFEGSNNSTPETFIESDENTESHNTIDGDDNYENLHSDYEDDEGYDFQIMIPTMTKLSKV